MKKGWSALVFAALFLMMVFVKQGKGQYGPPPPYQLGQVIQTNNMMNLIRTRRLAKGKRLASGKKLSDKVKSSAAGRGAGRSGASPRRGTTRFVSTAAPLAPARLAAELGRTPAERLQVERALAAMLA
ncbi:hypothetical protein, partial [Thermogemmatispora sp.]|uniref:hypothetical protein n=1 Tax=Thermogemmatispora sp. TaxID=1968838 RepID=UPI0035E43A5E